MTMHILQHLFGSPRRIRRECNAAHLRNQCVIQEQVFPEGEIDGGIGVLECWSKVGMEWWGGGASEQQRRSDLERDLRQSLAVGYGEAARRLEIMGIDLVIREPQFVNAAAQRPSPKAVAAHAEIGFAPMGQGFECSLGWQGL